MRKLRQKINLILTLVVMLMMAQTAWAADQTVTYRLITGTKGVIKANIDGNVQDIIVPIGPDVKIASDGRVSNNSTSHVTEDAQIKTSHINGKIKQVEFTNIRRGLSTAFEDTYFMGIDGMKYGNADAVTETSEEGSVTFTSTTGVLSTNNLTIKLGAESNFRPNSNCDLVITYEPSAAPVHTHNFSFNAVGNTLTATCGHSDGLDCSLADASYQATLTLSPSVDTYYRPNSTYSATLNLMAFNALTGLNATATDITYVDNISGDNLGTAAPTTAGNYTASVTVTVGGTDYTLSTDFTVNTENNINSNIRQISVNKTSARNDEEITITFTPRLHELVNTLTVTGTTTNMSIGNGITKVDEYTYTFLMPYEEVTIGATFKSSDASLYKYAITTDITGSGAVDYNAEEYLGVGDAITITFMPYLQNNLEAGSVVLEGLTVTGATTNMSVGNGITDNNDNTYTFTMPGENVTVTAKAYLSADAILAGTINEPIYIKQGNGIQIGCNNKWTYVNDGALPLVIPDGNTLRLAGGTFIRLNLADKNAIVCEGDAIVELIPNEVRNQIWIEDQYDRNSGKATIKVGPAGKTLTIRVADESIETVHLTVESSSGSDRSCDVIGCDEGGSCGNIVVESGQVESMEHFNHSGRAFHTTDGTITFGYKYPDDQIIFSGGIEGTVKIEDGKQFHSYTDNNTKYSGTINLQGINYFYALPDKYTVTFDENGGSDVDNQTVAHGMKATEPATTREGFTFRGWKKGDDVYDFNTVVTSDLTLTVGWTRPITTEGITVTIPSVEWTGSEIAFDETAVVVKDGETTLTLTTDYIVTAPTGTLQDTGDYPVTITGAGEYAGEVVAMFTIKGKPVTVKNDKNEDVPAATGDAEITQDQDGLTLTLTTPTESTTPHTVNVPQPVEVDHVSIDRTFEAGKACTLYLPFSIAADKITGGTFNTFTGVDTSNPTEWIVQYSPVAGDIEANTPYIFLPNSSNGGKITVNNGSDKVSICTANPHTTEKGQWDFIGTYERIKWTHNTSDPEYDSYREAEIGSIYGFAAEEKSGATVGQFVKVGNNVWINPMRAYLKYNATQAPSMDGKAATTELPEAMKVVIVESNGEVTEIGTITNSRETKTDNGWFTLDGRMLQGKPAKKGLYIHNGRKEVVK